MNKLFYALLLTPFFTIASTNTHAEVVYQLAGIDSAGTAVVIENSGAENWQVVFENTLEGCRAEANGNLNDFFPNASHQPLDKNQFAFGCSNGYVFIAENGKPADSVQLPTSYMFWYDTASFYKNEKIGIFLESKTSPVLIVFNKEFNDTFGKNWLFAAQKGNLFIIDINTKQLVSIPSWPIYLGFYGYSYLRMGNDRHNIDYTLPMAGFDIYKDKQDTFHLLGAMELPSEKTKKPKLLIQRLPLPDGTPGQQWQNQPGNPPAHYHAPSNYGSDKFNCDIADWRSGILGEDLPKSCHWPHKLNKPPAPRELKGLTGDQPQLDHYHSHITFERSPDNTDYSVRMRTNENAFGWQEL
ncbi:hypothetical protein NX722_17515 [Endozoicomonas gorgoniicola]|uniref:Uncharacterized protein n=1 Tax=Endozoicomonas gorgoniicola TaxID=1234144 RepID=A0ABT3MYD0_9GAMM|nr:hypothetical protein [Endozoicomonas gorgoniicola]MCW7554385.1 hypothetical protein [Endozoicomonas gorgoniicola]